MVILQQSTIHQLTLLLDDNQLSTIDELLIPKNEVQSPRFFLESALEKLNQDSNNAFWWSPRLIVVNRLIVGMCGFKSPPEVDGLVEIGYGIIPSQRRQGFATDAVKLLLKEAFSTVQIQAVTACTSVSNQPSEKVLEKNGFITENRKIDPDDGQVWIWRKHKANLL
ncbi:GNAT family N-acetyltransferase [Plectonema cf. radiosum LEGE 06105]|uniref:GNAT family N-acetyltransferase n=1 Tax=Plectonema cf. radiosum LEGE 06105 TaxID=945769 RepID=A0A8J7F7V9_9CYAN|nr:GNAT family N-acetyltransferase [Plectonema radiosum]MBE9216227.1 GNAT family N-acetyltransferase [Plectonema cf. radiosum LEGE 06105]